MFFLAVVCFNQYAAFSQNAQVAVRMRVLADFVAFRDNHSLCVQAVRKVMLNLRVNLKISFSFAHKISKSHQVTSRPLTRMLMALAVPAIVLMKSPTPSTCPTNSGNVYTSAG